MSKLHICAFMNYVHHGDVQALKNNIIAFKAGKNWTRLPAKAKVTYQSGTETPDAGPVKKETVTVTADSGDVQSLFNALEYYILQLNIGGKDIIVGSMDYPAKKIVADDKIRATVTFTRTSTL